MSKSSTMSDITLKKGQKNDKSAEKPYSRVIKIDSNLFIVDTIDGHKVCNARKKVKNKTDIVVGDFVEVGKSEQNDAYVISSIAKRKNHMVRPLCSNIDLLIIVVASKPLPDWFLIDKLIINAENQGIDVVICQNKKDLESTIANEIKEQYGNVVDKIISTCAKSIDIDELRAVMRGKLCCFAGQSAVGKSTLINALMGIEKQKTGEVSKKLERGKNTTTRAEILKVEKDTYIIDTPGFSMLDIHYISHYDLDLHYNEYVEVSKDCKYHRCTHTLEPQCKVKELVESGQLNESRYKRYVTMKQELKDNKDKVKSYSKKLQ